MENLLTMDTNIALSIINMKLRDFYSNLTSLCDDIGINEIALEEKFKIAGYEYNKELNQFK